MKKIIIILAVVVACGTLSAQSSVWKVNWDMNVPIGQTSDFVGKFSVRGLSVDGSWFLNDNVALGGTIAWGLFYEKTGQMTQHVSGTYADGDITGHQWRYNNFVPLLFNGEYYLGNAGKVRPYFGLGLGASWSEIRNDIGLYEIYNKEWMFTLAPAVGVIIPIANNINAHVKAKYVQGFSNETDLQTFTISVGFAFTNYRY